MKTKKIVMLVSAMLLSGASMAYEAGDVVIKAGVITVSPNESSDQVMLNGATALGEVEVDSDTQLGITGTYMLSAHIGVELLAATPFEHEIKGSSGAINNLDIGSTKHLPPSLMGVYYPLDSKSAFQPYAGLGINYTTFFDEETSAALSSTLGTLDSSMELDDSWGWTAQLGADYVINEQWLLSVSYRYIDIDTTATIKAGANRLKVDVDIDPWVPMVGVGFKF
jgi:outer membrane protein